MARATINLPDELDEEIESELSYGDSKSEWIRQAIKMRQHVDPILDELYESHQREERLLFVEKAVGEKTDEIKQDPNRGNGNDGGL
jgi:Arc/MetJ-type ribon-helix-helix transcriptional regulator